jgi:hypothetical protein
MQPSERIPVDISTRRHAVNPAMAGNPVLLDTFWDANRGGSAMTRQ